MKWFTFVVQLLVLTAFLSVYSTSYAGSVTADETSENKTKSQNKNRQRCRLNGPYGPENIPSIKGYIVKIVNDEFQKIDNTLIPVSKVKYKDITKVKFSSLSLGEEGFGILLLI